MSNLSGDHTWASLRRAWIERTAWMTGTIRRKDICAALGLSMAQASADLQQLQAEHPGCLQYDLNAKCYRWAAGSTPLLPVPPFLRILTDAIRIRPDDSACPRAHRYDWTRVDWTKTNYHIAMDLGCSAKSVARQRRILRQPAPQPHAKLDWASVDWARMNKDIAHDLGTTPAYVSSMRVRKGLRIQAKRDWSGVDWSQSSTALAQKYRVSVGRISVLRRRFAPETLR